MKKFDADYYERCAAHQRALAEKVSSWFAATFLRTAEEFEQRAAQLRAEPRSAADKPNRRIAGGPGRRVADFNGMEPRGWHYPPGTDRHDTGPALTRSTPRRSERRRDPAHARSSASACAVESGHPMKRPC